MRIRVDLPAPFSPTRAWISPARLSKETTRSACTPGNAFDTPATASAGGAASWLMTTNDGEELAEYLGELLLQQIRVAEYAVGQRRTHVVLVVVFGDQLWRDDPLLLDFLPTKQRERHAQRDHAFPSRLGDQTEV